MERTVILTNQAGSSVSLQLDEEGIWITINNPNDNDSESCIFLDFKELEALMKDLNDLAI